MASHTLRWIDIIRLGFVQAALGSVVVLTTSTLNRVMVVELGLAAMVPGFLIALHYMVQMSRPRWGFGSDEGGRRTPWIIGGMATLVLGAWLAAGAVVLHPGAPVAAGAMALVGFILIGVGVGAAGTSLLAFLATHVSPERRAPAAASVWLMMIAGFIVTAATTGALLDPYSPERLMAIATGVGCVAFVVALAAVAGIERRFHGRTAAAASLSSAPAGTASAATQKQSFRDALAGVWAEPSARRFTIFVFVSMLAFSAQDLILEPFAGLVFAMTPGQSTSLSGVQHSGVFAGMALIGVAGNIIAKRYAGIMRLFTVAGCLASALALFCLALGGAFAPDWPLETNVFLLGFANGVFAVAAIGSMMGLAGDGRENREGTRMGLWGAAQAIAFGLGSFLGTVGVDAARALTASNATAYGAVFVIEGLLFVVAAGLAARLTVSALANLKRDEPFGTREIVKSVIRHSDAQLARSAVATTPSFAGERPGALQ